MATAAQRSGRTEVARYTATLSPVNHVEDSLITVQSQPERLQEPIEDLIKPLEVEREALQKAWKQLKSDLKEQGKEDKFYDSEPGDFRSLIEIARGAQKALSERKGFWVGKPKEYFNKFCEKAWAHQFVFDFFPDTNEYATVFCGVIKTLVKASVNYIKISEALGQALDDITDYVVLARKQVESSPQPFTKNALAGLYKEIFLYLKDFTEWFTIKSRRRLLRSFNGDVYAKYSDRMKRIERKAQTLHQAFLVDTAHNLQSKMPTMESLEQDRRKNTDGIIMEFDKLLDKKLESFRKEFTRIQFYETGLRASGMLEGVYRTEQWQQGQVLQQQQYLLNDQTAPSQSGISIGRGLFDEEVRRAISMQRYTRSSLLSASEELETFILGNSVNLLQTLPPSPYATVPVAIKIQEWLGSRESIMLWAHGSPTRGYPTEFSSLAGSLINAAIASGNKVIFHFCEPPRMDEINQELTLEQAGMVSLVYSLIRQLIYLLDEEITEEEDLSDERFRELENPLASWKTAMKVLERLLDQSPRFLICVIDGVIDLDYSHGAPMLLDLLTLLQGRGQRAQQNGYIFKCLFTSNGDSNTLENNLSDEQVVNDMTPSRAWGALGNAGPGQRYIFDDSSY